MKKNAIASRYLSVVQAADNYNSRIKYKRFYPMSQRNGHFLVEVGLYDYKTKKYVLRDTASNRIESTFKYIEDLIANAEG